MGPRNVSDKEECTIKMKKTKIFNMYNNLSLQCNSYMGLLLITVMNICLPSACYKHVFQTFTGRNGYTVRHYKASLLK